MGSKFAVNVILWQDPSRSDRNEYEGLLESKPTWEFFSLN